MKKISLPLLAMLIAVTVTLSIFFIIPVPPTRGFVTLAEVGIYTTSLLFGGVPGMIVGAASGGLIDLISGYPEWALFSIIIHGLQGYITGRLAEKAFKGSDMTGLALGSIVMVAGYFFAGWFLFGLGSGLASIVGNIVQNGFGIIVTLPVVKGLARFQGIRKDRVS